MIDRMPVGRTPSHPRTSVPLGIGALVMLSALGPSWAVVIATVIGSFVAGMVDPDAPVRAGLLVLAPAVLAGLVRILVETPESLGRFLLALVSGAVFVLVLSHLGAGVQRRRSASRT